MDKKFEMPIVEMVALDNDVIVTSCPNQAPVLDD